MDFDDLLADPFTDPFAKPRSGSPDPWATFSHQSIATPDEDDPYKSVYDENRSTTPTNESYGTAEHGLSRQASTEDPLEASAVNAEDEESTSPQTPGFRESISALNPTDHTQTISEPEPPSPTPSPPPVVHERVPSPPKAKSPERFPAKTPVHSPSPSTSKVTSPVVSPLDRPQPAFTGLDRSFSGLALGGESAGGWQADQGSWVNERTEASVSGLVSPPVEEEEDDDDDVPIMQTRPSGTMPTFVNLLSVFFIDVHH